MLQKTVIRTSSARIPTKYGEFQLSYYTNTEDDKAHLALCMGDFELGENILVRVHSECFTGDVLMGNGRTGKYVGVCRGMSGIIAPYNAPTPNPNQLLCAFSWAPTLVHPRIHQSRSVQN